MPIHEALAALGSELEDLAARARSAAAWARQLAADAAPAPVEEPAPPRPEIIVTDPPRFPEGYFVSPTGSAQGFGSPESPWDLPSVFAGRVAAITPGSTVWLRGGRYEGVHRSVLAGTAESPIIVRAYPGERVSLASPGRQDSAGVWDREAWPLQTDSAHVWYWGLEAFVDYPDRFQAKGERPNAIFDSGPFNKFINCVAHDGQVGFSWGMSAPCGELSGCIAYNNGFIGPDREHGHGYYVKNAGERKRARSCIAFNNFRSGMQVYTGSGSGELRAIDLDGFVSFNAGAIGRSESAVNLLVGGDEIADDIDIRGLMTYHAPGVTNRSVRLGYSNALRNGRLSLSAALLVGQEGQVLDVTNWSSIEISACLLAGKGRIVNVADADLSGHRWVSNQHRRDPAAPAWGHRGTYRAFDAWRSITLLATDDDVRSEVESSWSAHLHADAYEPERSRLVVHNWRGEPEVSVMVPLVRGDRYEVRNVQDLWGPPVARGTYGGGTISIPMTGVEPPAPIGTGVPGVAPKTAPFFDVFIVQRVP